MDEERFLYPRMEAGSERRGEPDVNRWFGSITVNQKGGRVGMRVVVWCLEGKEA